MTDQPCTHGTTTMAGTCTDCGAALRQVVADRRARLDCGCTEQRDDEHAPGCDRNHYPHDACEPENLDPAECCGAEPGAPCRPWCVNADEPIR